MAHGTILGALLLLSLMVPPATDLAGISDAAVITVTTTVDEVADNAECSLREAILAANTDVPVGGCAAGNGADTISLSPVLSGPASFVLTRGGADEDDSLTGDLDIRGELAIVGSGATVMAVDGNSADRVFEILPGARVTMTGLKVWHGAAGANGAGGIFVGVTGSLIAADIAVSDNQGAGILSLGQVQLSAAEVARNSGAGVKTDGGSAVLEGVALVANGGAGAAASGNATLRITSGSVRGNAVGVSNAESTTTLSGTEVLNNAGAGVMSSGVLHAMLKLNLSTVSANGPATMGGGIVNFGANATAEVATSSVTGNRATASGGGIYNNGHLTVRESVIAGNTAGSGAGIDHAGGMLQMTNVTLSGNTADDNGGGIYSRASATLSFVTLADNSAGGPTMGAALFNDEASLTFQNSIISSPAGQASCANTQGHIVSGGYNVEHGASCGLQSAGDANADPLIGPLGDNGGPTRTHALLPGSPAIERATPLGCPATDQRGVARPQGARCDAGAVEYTGALPPRPFRLLLPSAWRS